MSKRPPLGLKWGHAINHHIFLVFGIYQIIFRQHFPNRLASILGDINTTCVNQNNAT